MFEELAPEFNQPNTVACTTFLHDGKTYTISTCQLSLAPLQFYASAATAIGDALNGNRDLTGLDYETMLFVDGQSNGVTVYPFGNMEGNRMQGIFQRYGSEDEAKQGHQEFVAKVKQALIDRVKSDLVRKE